jgi:hypothetical protein
MRFPGDSRVTGQHPIKHTAIKQYGDYRYYNRGKVSPEKTKKDQKERQAINDPTCTDMVRWPGKQPDECIGPEVGPEEDRTSNPLVKEEQRSPQEEQGNSVGNKMVDIAMSQWAYKNSNDTFKRPGLDTILADIPMIIYFQEKAKPHEKHQT